jgi:exodeoxyribonuclease V gamma subunit
VLNIRFSNRFETLRDALTSSIGAAPGSVFEAPQVVVPSSAVRRALSLALADRYGICANVEFVYLAAWLWRQIGRVVESVEVESPFAARVMAWAVYELLSESSWTAAFPRLAHYLKDADAVRRWDLAGEIAVVLEQYITYRQDWLMAWANGERVGVKSASMSAHADQDWQAELWRRLLARLGSNQEHPANRFFRSLKASATAAAGARSAELPAAVHVFCLPTIPPLYLDVLIGLGHWIDVQLYVLNPCREYWFDIVDPKRLSHLIVRREATHLETVNRLLASWGSQTRGQIELLLDRSGDSRIGISNDPSGSRLPTTKPFWALRVFVWVKVAHFLFKTRAACRSAPSSEGILHPEVHTLGAG